MIAECNAWLTCSTMQDVPLERLRAPVRAEMGDLLIKITLDASKPFFVQSDYNITTSAPKVLNQRRFEAYERPQGTH